MTHTENTENTASASAPIACQRTKTNSCNKTNRKHLRNRPTQKHPVNSSSALSIPHRSHASSPATPFQNTAQAPRHPPRTHPKSSAAPEPSGSQPQIARTPHGNNPVPGATKISSDPANQRTGRSQLRLIGIIAAQLQSVNLQCPIQYDKRSPACPWHANPKPITCRQQNRSTDGF